MYLLQLSNVLKIIPSKPSAILWQFSMNRRPYPKVSLTRFLFLLNTCEDNPNTLIPSSNTLTILILSIASG